MPDDILIYILYPVIAGIILAAIFFISKAVYSRIRKRIEKPVSITQLPKIVIEAKENGNIYRAKKSEHSYLLLNLIIVNESPDLLTIRNIEAIMNNAIGNMLSNSQLVYATHLGNSANYSLGVTPHILPLVLYGNSPKEAYLGFEFSSNTIETGKIELKLFTSKGDIVIPVAVTVIG